MTRKTRRGVVGAWMLLGLGLGHGGVTDSVRAATPFPSQDRETRTLQPVELPDVGRLHPLVSQQLSDAYASLMATARDADVPRYARSDAYGEMGKLFMAAEFLHDAERCFQNAALMSPDVFRWSYYLAHLLRNMGALSASVERFERALELRPTDEAALVWLGRVYLELGRPEAAAQQVTLMLARYPEASAVRFEAGRVALAQQDYASSVEHLAAALALDPGASVIHYPLAMAYRHLGDLEQAEHHLQRRGGRASRGSGAGVPVRLSDPLMAELNAVLRNPQAFRVLAFQAAANLNWPEAVTQFRKAVDAAPDYAAMRLNLGTALERVGDARGAQAQFEEALRLDPRMERAHYSLAALLERSGRDAEAIERLVAAVTHDPSFAAAHLMLADALRRADRLVRSVTHYRRVIDLEPGNATARFGEAMALVRLERYGEAAERLTAAIRIHAERTEFPHALARLLAAAPDDQVRDGARAWGLIQSLAATEQNSAVAETMAMALAELGFFEPAIVWQRRAISIAERAERPDIALRMAANLVLYQQQQPCRAPWRDDNPDLRPGPRVEPGLLDPPAPQ